LLRLESEWETVQASRNRDAIYGYLTAVFELVMWWVQEGKAVTRAGRALHLRGHHSDREPEPFAAVILCTADCDHVDDRTRSKWSRALRYAAEYKDWASRWVISSSARAVSTNVRADLRVASGEVARRIHHQSNVGRWLRT
jgi:hypothetical protein